MIEEQEMAADDLVRLVTIGVPMGTIIHPQTGEKGGMLRHGRKLLTLDADAYKVLFFASGPMSRADLIENARNHGVGNPSSVIQECGEAGLLREIDFSARMPDDRWRDVRLVPMGMGLGIDENNVGRIAVPGAKETKKEEVDRFAYSVWAASDGRSVQEVVDALAAEVGAAELALASHWGIGDMDRMAQVVTAKPEVAPDFIGSAIPRTILTLLLREAACLDRVP
jgi:hypothetical protein